MIDLDDIFEMGRNTKGAYTLFCNHVLSAVVGKNVWKAKCAGFAVSNIATISDEAFALVLLVNSWDVWSDTTNSGDSKTRFTRNGAGTKKNEGWTQEGLEQFNQIARMVRTDRKTTNRKKFEETYMRDKLETAANKRMKHGHQKADDGDEKRLMTYIEGDLDTSDDDDSSSTGSGGKDEKGGESANY